MHTRLAAHCLYGDYGEDNWRNIDVVIGYTRHDKAKTIYTADVSGGWVGVCGVLVLPGGCTCHCCSHIAAWEHAILCLV